MERANASPPTVVIGGQATADVVHPDDGSSRTLPMRLGGKALNQAVALARLGLTPSLATAVGNDAIGGQIRRLLEHEGVDTGFVVTAGGRPPILSRISSVKVELTEGRTSPRHVSVSTDPRILDYFDSAISLAMRAKCPSAILTTFELPDSALEELLVGTRQVWKRTYSILVVNPAPARPVPESVFAALKHCDLLVPNRAEAASLLGRLEKDLGDPLAAARDLRRLTGARRVCITLGRDGAAGSDRRGTFLQPAYRTRVKDKVGASDAFVAATTAALAAGTSFRGAVEFATVCAAISVGREGGVAAFPTPAEVVHALASTSGAAWRQARTTAHRLAWREARARTTARL